MQLKLSENVENYQNDDEKSEHELDYPLVVPAEGATIAAVPLTFPASKSFTSESAAPPQKCENDQSAKSESSNESVEFDEFQKLPSEEEIMEKMYNTLKQQNVTKVPDQKFLNADPK